jgi:hypothetical protein
VTLLLVLFLQVDKLLIEKITQPEMDLSKSPAVEAMLKLLATDGF